MNIYEERWEAAKEFFKLFKYQIRDLGGTHILYEDELFNTEQLIIGNDEIYFCEMHSCGIIHRHRKAQGLFYNHPDYDEGSNTEIKEFQENFLSKIKVYKEVVINNECS